MSWTRVDDKWHGHKKTRALSLAARGAWVTVLSWAGMFAPDGCFGDEELEGLFPRTKPAELKKIVAELTRVLPGYSSGYWERTETGYRIHDLTFYRAPERDKLTPEQRSSRAKAAAETRWKAPATDAHEHASEHANSITEPCSEHAEADAYEQCGSMPSYSRPVPSRPDPDPRQSPEHEGPTAGGYRQTDETANQLSVTLAVPLDELREVEGLVIARLLASAVAVKGNPRRYAQTALLEALRDPVRRSEARQTIAARREAADREASRSKADSEALERIAADNREAARRAALTPAQREIEDALHTLRRSKATLAATGMPQSALGPARAAQRASEATLARHGVKLPLQEAPSA